MLERLRGVREEPLVASRRGPSPRPGDQRFGEGARRELLEPGDQVRQAIDIAELGAGIDLVLDYGIDRQLADALVEQRVGRGSEPLRGGPRVAERERDESGHAAMVDQERLVAHLASGL